MPSFLKSKTEQKSPSEKTNQALEIDQRVVAFIDDYPARGTVRYVGKEEDASGNMRTIVGLELVRNPHKLEYMYHEHVNCIFPTF